MIRFEHTEVMNFEGAMRGMRNSWESWDKSDGKWDWRVSSSAGSSYKAVWDYVIGPKDLERALALSRAGSDHAKYLRQIFVSVDIVAPEYWWKEMDTYKVGTVANSTSMMHKLGSRELTVEDFGFDNQAGASEVGMLYFLNYLRTDWINAGKKKPSPEWRRMLQHIPQSFLYRRTWTASYAVLQNIYRGRKGHRLEEWEQFREWVRSLPYSELITLEVPE